MVTLWPLEWSQSKLDSAQWTYGDYQIIYWRTGSQVVSAVAVFKKVKVKLAGMHPVTNKWTYIHAVCIKRKLDISSFITYISIFLTLMFFIFYLAGGKMVTSQEKAQCVLWFSELKSATQMQRKLENVYSKNPVRDSIYRWMKQFKDTGYLFLSVWLTSTLQTTPTVL